MNSSASDTDFYVEGYTLDRNMYSSEQVFRQDMQRIFHRSWTLVGHASQLPEIGSYFVTDVHGESIIVVRNAQGIEAFYNVCSHRGSRVCLHAAGTTDVFRCPYHAWSFRLDGSLRAAPLMAADFDRQQHGLRKCASHVFEGVIFINLADEPGDFENLYGSFHKFLASQNLAHAKVAVVKDIPVAANWKLVNENFLECYHCAATHPQFVEVQYREQLAAMSGGSAEDTKKYEAILKDWETQTQALGHVTGEAGRQGAGLYDFAWAARMPLKAGCFSQTQHGAKVAPLLGLKQWDCGSTMVLFNPFSQVFISNDHATMFSFFPKGPLETVIRIWWLVDAAAQPGVDYDPDAVAYMWTVTTEQDRALVEGNQAGVLSRAFKPSRFSEMEKGPISLLNWYIAQMRDVQSGNSSAADPLRTA